MLTHINKTTHIVYQIILVFFIISFLGCKTSKTLSINIENHTEERIKTSLLNHNIPFRWFAAKGNINLSSDEQNISGGFDVRLRADSVLVMSAKKIGVEALRIRATPKEYTILYRLEGVYETRPIGQLKKLSNIDMTYADMEQMLVGNIILPDTQKLVDLKKTDQFYSYDYTENEVHIQYIINRSDLTLHSVKYVFPHHQTVTSTFASYQMINKDIRMPFNRSLRIDNHSKIYEVEIELENIEVDIPKTIKFSIPNSYEKL